MADDEPIGLLLAAVRRRIRQAVGSRVRGYRLSTQQFWVLVTIHEHPGWSLRELAAHLRMDEPTASRVVFALRQRRLVKVTGDAADRRRARIGVAPAGAALGPELLEVAGTVRAAIVWGLSAAQQRVLRASLRRIIVNMEQFQNGHEARGVDDE